MSENGNGNGENGNGRPDLTDKQRLFIRAYLNHGARTWLNATRSAEAAGYGNGSQGGDPEKAEGVWRSYGCQTLANVSVRAEIDRQLEQYSLSPAEVLTILGRQARGNMTDLLREDIVMLDKEKVRQNGHLIKTLRWTKEGLSVELYSAQEAVRDIGKALGMFKDRLAVEGELEIGVRLDR
jgi:hypothetical protein